jgi:glucans biosynthesis protein C
MEIAASGANRPLPVAADAHSTGCSRLLFVDNIRVYLTILVILHHLMITYAGTGRWYYTEGRQDFVTRVLGAWFSATDQAYFMGLFLLISAYFLPGSYDRKGAGRFLKDRLIRLGIPLAVFSWVINPLFIYGIRVLTEGPQLPYWSYFTSEYFKTEPLIGAGPLWFVELLLIFSLLYMLWRLLVRYRPVMPVVETRFPGNGAIALFALLLGIAGFLVRLVFVMDAYTFKPLNLQFPFFAQYIALFVVGLIAYRRNWLMGLPDKAGRLWLGIAGLLIVLWIPMVLAGGGATDVAPFKGGWHWQAQVYALWESFLAVSMCIGLIYAFRRYLNRRGKIAGFLVPNAYTAYIIHTPLITALAFAVRDIPIYPLLKWLVVASLAVPICFGLSSLIRKLPYMDRVL